MGRRCPPRRWRRPQQQPQGQQRQRRSESLAGARPGLRADGCEREFGQILLNRVAVKQQTPTELNATGVVSWVQGVLNGRIHSSSQMRTPWLPLACRQARYMPPVL